MGVDPKWGHFQICPEFKCPVLYWAPRRTKEDKRRQNGIFRDKLGTGQLGNAPPFRIQTPCSALDKNSFFASRDSGVCDSNRIAHRNGIVRFGPPSYGL